MSYQSINPASGETLQTFKEITDQELEAALQAAEACFLSWRDLTFVERAAIAHKAAGILRSRLDDFARPVTLEMGKRFEEAQAEVRLSADIIDYYAEHAEDFLAPENLHPESGAAHIESSPLGVLFGVQPWNFPYYQLARFAAPNLMAGNGVLLKHAANCTGSGMLLRDIYERAGLPKGLFTVLTIDHDQSDKLIEHPLVRGVTMTGSAKGGSVVAAKAGEHLKKTVMELGSNDAYLVLEDADIDVAVEYCVAGRIYNNGQTCVNAKRFIVTEAVYDAFVDGYVKAMAAIKTGDPTDDNTGLGPMARDDLRDTLHEQVQQSVAKGAKVACGGKTPDGKGYFYPATVLTDVSPGQPAYDDELFGPVASVIRAKDDEDAMRIANDSRFGLGGGIFCKDEKHAVELAKAHFDTGMIFINHFNLASPEMPFGGVKDSGYGREHGGFGMLEFVNAKSIALPA